MSSDAEIIVTDAQAHSRLGTIGAGSRQSLARSAVVQQIWPISALALSVLAACWPLIRALPNVWFGYETYYAHGALVPVCSAFIVWDRWAIYREIPIKGSNWAVLSIIGLLVLAWPLYRSDMHSLMSIHFVLLGLCSVWFVAGSCWVRALAPAAGYLLLGLPVFGVVIDRFTQPLQALSTTMAFGMLGLVGLRPFRVDANTIALNNYSLQVGIPCSGLKLMLAVASIVIFFVMIARLRLWASALLLILIVPLALFVNGLRILGVGLVGDRWGATAGHQFHDYSGYISLVICFALLYGLTRLLGWKS